ncbi:MAG: hypothetical protein M1434_01155 [Chloroflexi bacterium]|nr:hypothetical protein [Chloroflexota bacterium]MCL5273339.1 hypothetical protein [Chloroflexota bacterium]
MPSQTIDANTILAVMSVLSTCIALAALAVIAIQAIVQARIDKNQIFNSAVDRLESVRTDRRELRSYVKNVNDQKQQISYPLPPDIEKVVDRVCREFDFLGLLDRTNRVDHHLVDMFYSVPFVKLYEEILGGYVNQIRQENKRGPTHLWELVQFYERVKYVPTNHPAVTGEMDWPQNPRTKRVA